MAKKVFNMAGGLHSAAAYAAFENRVYGSCVANAASLVVTPGSGMNVNISSGDGLISVDAFLARRIQVTATETATVPAASASFNRIDSVVAYIDTTVTPTTSVIDNINDVLKFKVVAGTAASTPAAPTGAAIQASVGSGNPYMVLYDLLLPQSAANVAGITLTDRRAFPTAAAVADGIITTSKIGNLAVTTAKIANAAVTAAKMDYTTMLPKIIKVTKNTADAAGNQSFTGVGFKPSAVVAIFAGPSTSGSAATGVGIFTAADGSGTGRSAPGIGYQDTTSTIFSISPSSGNAMNANVVSMDADGFTLNWYKYGSPSGISNIAFLCFR